MFVRFYNARIMTLVNGVEIMSGELWTEEDRILYIGPEKAKAAAAIEWDREIDAQGNVLMPGFKNAHSHSAMTFLRSYADDLPLQEWLQQQVFPMEAKLTADDIYHLVKLGIMEYLTSGITACFDMYLAPDMMAQAAKDCGFRMVLCGAVNDFTHSVEELEQQYLRHNRERNSLVSMQLGFHAEYTTSADILTGVARLAEKYQAPIYAHISESETEVQQCLERTGMTPPQYLDSLGMFKYGGGGFHCVHMTEEDLNIFKAHNLSIITNPSANAKLASGIAPITKMMDMKLNIGIGTDGPASNNCLDMFREMFLVTGLAKLREKDAAVVDAEEVLKMGTIGSAKAMGLTECDVLAEGKKADIIMIDLHQPNMQPLNHIGKNIVYSGSKQNIKMTMIGGKILYENGEFAVNIPVEEVYEKANEIIRRVVGCNSYRDASKRVDVPHTNTSNTSELTVDLTLR